MRLAPRVVQVRDNAHRGCRVSGRSADRPGLSAGDGREEHTLQTVPQLGEIPTACRHVPELGGEIVDRSASTAAVARPTTLGFVVHMQAWRAVRMERTGNLVAARDNDAGQQLDIDGG